MSETIFEVTLWVCPVCNYWRAEKTTGRHQTANLLDPHGPLLVHGLEPVRFYSEKHPGLAEHSHALAPAEQGHGRPEDGPGEEQTK